jgi:hypothetical protein
MSRIILLFSLCFLLSCKKDEKPHPASVQNPRLVLTSHPWFRSEYREMRTNLNTSIVEYDSTSGTSSCYSDKPLILKIDSSATYDLSCVLTGPNPKPGTWSLTADSSFIVYIPIARISYGGGYVISNFGIPYGKLLLLTDTKFQSHSATIWYMNGVPYRYDNYYTFVK